MGSTRRGVLRLMKDFMTLLREAEVGVMSIWFLCTVCRKVRRGRTTCRTQGQGPAGGAASQGRQSLAHLAGRTGRGRGLVPGGLQLLFLQMLLLVQLTHRLLVATLPPAMVGGVAGAWVPEPVIPQKDDP